MDANALRTSLRTVRGVLLDLDGTVYEGDTLVAGVKETVATLSRRNIRIRFGTNTTRMSRSDIVARLGRMGLTVDPADVFTAPLAAVALLREKRISRVSLFVPEAARQDFSEFQVSDDEPEAVVIGDLGPAWSFDRLNRAFRQVLEGAVLLALHRNRYWRAEDGLALDAGPFVAAIEYATGATAIITGKPNPVFFSAAAQSMELPLDALLVVGDDVETDILGGVTAGAMGALVRTGKFRPADEAAQPGGEFSLIDSVADVPELLGLETNPDP